MISLVCQIFAQLCKKVAPRLNLAAVCQQFVACQFYMGVLELCICCAEAIDPNNAASHFYKNNEPQDDNEGYQAFMKRYTCLQYTLSWIALSDNLDNPIRSLSSYSSQSRNLQGIHHDARPLVSAESVQSFNADYTEQAWTSLVDLFIHHDNTGERNSKIVRYFRSFAVRFNVNISLSVA